MGVVPNSNFVLLFGNDLIGGPNAKFEILAMNAGHCAYVLSDKKGNTGIVHYLKNIEGAAFPSPPITNTVNAAVTSSVAQLFR